MCEGHWTASQCHSRRRRNKRHCTALPWCPSSEFLDGDAPAADKVQAFLARTLQATGSDATTHDVREFDGHADIRKSQ